MGAYPSAAAQLGQEYERGPSLADLMTKQQLGQQAVQAGQQQLQSGGIELQQKQQQLADTQAITRAWQAWDGKDPQDLVHGVIQAGGSGAAAGQLYGHILEMQKAKMGLDTDAFALSQKRNDRMLGRIDSAKSVSDAQLPGYFQRAIQDSVSSGDLDPQHAQIASQILQQNGGNPAALRASIDSFEKAYQLESTQFSRAQEERKTAAAETTAQGALGRGQGAIMSAQTNQQKLQQELPGGALYKAPGAVTPEDVYREQSQNARQAREIQSRTQEKQSADEQKRSDLAQNLNENLDALEKIVTNRPELFGPAAGRWTGLKMAFGSDDPDIGALKTIEHQIGMVQQSTHGMRSAYGVQSAADSVLNSFHNSPKALMGAIQAARNSSKTFLSNANPGKAGTQQQNVTEFDYDPATKRFTQK